MHYITLQYITSHHITFPCMHAYISTCIHGQTCAYIQQYMPPVKYGKTSHYKHMPLRYATTYVKIYQVGIEHLQEHAPPRIAFFWQENH